MISIGRNLQGYKVICVRAGGERLLISTHASQESAEVAVNLMRNCGDIGEIRIESQGRRGRRRTRRAG
jgi:hypothetical protein